MIDNFFGIMKSECLYRKEFKSIEHFKKELAKYIKYNNHKRIKAKLKGHGPVTILDPCIKGCLMK
ncbi:hypothetical protein AT260_16860 [Bacillus wiedmannii]|nr:hypothetical protein AT260_16860 [Bacillus wiedmannii]